MTEDMLDDLAEKQKSNRDYTLLKVCIFFVVVFAIGFSYQFIVTYAFMPVGAVVSNWWSGMSEMVRESLLTGCVCCVFIVMMGLVGAGSKI